MKIKPDFADRIEGMEGLDRYVKQLSNPLAKLVPGRPVRDLLAGTWLTHPTHPMLTDVVIGAWTSAGVLDVVGGSSGRDAARRLIGVGILASVPTALAGLADWLDTTDRRARRVGLIHAAGNVTALTLYSLSWLARRRLRQGRGLFWAMLGAGAATFSGLLGGHLSFRRGVGVDQTVFDRGPRSWTAVFPAAELAEGSPVGAAAGTTPVFLYRQGDRIFVLVDRCSHRGCGLSHGGTVADGAVTCPCHGSTFRLEDGSILRGPATAPQPTLDVRLQNGTIEVRGR